MEPRWAVVTPTHRSQFRGWSKGGWTRWRTTWRGRRGRGRGRRRRPTVATTDAGRRASRAAKASTTHSGTSRRGSLETRLVVIKKSGHCCTVVEWTPHDQEVVGSNPIRLHSFLSLSFSVAFLKRYSIDVQDYSFFSKRDAHQCCLGRYKLSNHKMGLKKIDAALVLLAKAHHPFWDRHWALETWFQNKTKWVLLTRRYKLKPVLICSKLATIWMSINCVASSIKSLTFGQLFRKPFGMYRRECSLQSAHFNSEGGSISMADLLLLTG